MEARKEEGEEINHETHQIHERGSGRRDGSERGPWKTRITRKGEREGIPKPGIGEKEGWVLGFGISEGGEI